MNFDKLYELALEAAKNFGSPKNIGGSRLNQVKQSTGPSGFVSSSVGKSDNFQERVPIDQKNKKGFSPSKSATQSKKQIEVSDDITGDTITRKKTDVERENVFKLIGGKSKALFNAFSLLNNSGYFKEKMANIINKFGDIATISSEDEKKLKNLRVSVDEKRSTLTKLKEDLEKYKNIVSDYNDSEDVKAQTEIDLSAAKNDYETNVENLKKKKGGSKLNKALDKFDTLQRRKQLRVKYFTSDVTRSELDGLNSDIFKVESEINDILGGGSQYQLFFNRIKKLSSIIEKLSTKREYQNLKPKDIYGVEGKSLGLLKLLDKTEKKYEATQTQLQKEIEELNALEKYTSNVTAHNDKLSDSCVADFKKLVADGAENILNSKFENFNSSGIDTTTVDWATELPDRNDIYKMLLALSSRDDSNPIYKFIDSLDNQYLYNRSSETETRGATRYDINKAISDNENITVMRDIERLPFHVIANYYKTVDIAAMPINDAITSESFSKAYLAFYNMCVNYEGKGILWNNGATKMKLKALLGIDLGMNVDMKNTSSMGEALSDTRKMAYERIIDGPYLDKKIDSFKSLLGMVNADLRSAFPRKFEAVKNKIVNSQNINESFDQFANNYASSFELDINDFMVDLQEVKCLLEKKCTGPTKKASSDRKGKKWTKCARQPDGSYKRIHWGQAGVRVGKDNPKRRKSFRARHKCSSAKSGSANAQSCKDWG